VIRPVLVIAHPGHELRVFAWMERAQPLVFVLTDGSGSEGAARIDSTTTVLRQTSSRPGSIYGRLSDRAIYAAMLEQDTGCFLQLADELADAIVAEGADCIVADAIEGFNPSHDVCRIVTNAALRLARRKSGRLIPSFDFLLEGPPDTCPPDQRERAIWVSLDDEALARKLAAADAYGELRSEVERTVRRFGTEPFRTECLRPSEPTNPYGWDPSQVPYYETYGAQRVAAGAYDKVLRFREHMQPIADALWSHSEPDT
jgi:hypothetical protein